MVPLLGRANAPGEPVVNALQGLGAAWCAGVAVRWPVPAGAPRAALPTYPFQGQDHWFKRKALASSAPAATTPSFMMSVEVAPTMSRIPNIERELAELMSGVSGLPAPDLSADAAFLDLGLDSLSLTQATLEIERVFGVKLRFRRLLEDLDSIGKLARHLDLELPAGKFAPAPAALLRSPFRRDQW
ncbi:acyl carrier protein [Piscinibacter aquaticus]|uniref:Acyl carrier protein n=1 Tax=Piscinibacter aquaticus TaxID=392597 RepID=A0A5C6U0H5_9BURK|nr:acyl carrier protein [Piscinibacter aquaticus]